MIPYTALVCTMQTVYTVPVRTPVTPGGRLTGSLPGGGWSLALAGVDGVTPPAAELLYDIHFPGVSAVRREVVTCTADGVRLPLFY